jgi:putative chitinase
MLDADILHQVFPVAGQRVIEFAPLLATTCEEFGIDTPLRVAYFLGQVGQESGELYYTQELASGQAYEGRKDLGNIVPGDGVRFKGRGLIQVTGRYNYSLAATALGLPLLDHPELLSQSGPACRVTGWFWQTKQLNHYADIQDINTLTRRINGGFNGLPNRILYTQRACKAFRITFTGA